MRSATEAQTCWTFLEKQITSLDDLRRLARQAEDLLSPSFSTTTTNTTSSPSGPLFCRSQLWKIFLLFETLDRETWPSKLRSSRDAYTSLRAHFLRGIEHPDEVESAADPLSDDAHSPWTTLRNDEALRQEILLDVDRCMPDNYYFRQPETQRLLLDILFLWSKLNMDVGYRQGMHEVLAPVLWVVERDAIDPATLTARDNKWSDEPSSATAMMVEMLDARFIGADTFTLFSLIMQHAKPSYEHVAPSSRKESKTAPVADTPMIARSKRIIEDYLAKVDPQLFNHIRDIEIVPQVFLIRWLRLLFGREFPFDQMLGLWDGLFAAANPFECIDLVCVAMLLRIRWQLIEADYNMALGLLINYPELSAESKAITLLDDALYLRDNLNSEGGSFIVSKYSGRSIPLRDNGSDQYQAVASTKRQSQRRRPALNPTAQVIPQFVGFEALLQDAARGMYTQGEKWGLNKAMRDAVGEVRKNMQGLHSRSHSRTDPHDQSLDERLRQKVESLQARNKTLARMLESAVSDLWQQQSAMAEEKSDQDPHVKALTVATAKVQLVQAYLNDSTIPLPSEEGVRNPEQSRSSTPVKEPTKPVQRKPGRRDSENSLTQERAADLSSLNRNSGEKQKPLPVPPRPESSSTPAASASPRLSASTEPATPDKPSARRHLAQSDFSWMLGQESPNSIKTPRSTFVSASPFFEPSDAARQPAGKRSHPAARGASNSFLFGDEEEEPALPAKGGDINVARHKNNDLFGISMKELEDRK